MLLNDLILKNPLGFLATENKDMLPPGQMGIILARAGVGKTALLVQLALNALLRQKNVLHISLNDPVKKVALWYEEMFRHLAGTEGSAQTEEIWEASLPHRFIMTFKVEGFSVPKLEERLTDLVEQDIFAPSVVLIDGIPFQNSVKETLEELKSLSSRLSFNTWVTATTHRHESPAENGLPVQLEGKDDLFDVAVRLQPEGKEIYVQNLLGDNQKMDNAPPLVALDPTTLLLKEER